METAKVTVLVVDDNPENRALAKATLEDEGYRVVVASGGEEAVRCAASECPDCILMDIRMPGIDGVTACERIRALPGGMDVAVVFLTAQRDIDTFDRALAAGGDDFISKPFRPSELIVRIQTAMRLRRIATERTELAAQLKRQRDVLQRLELHKEQVAAFVVHDLKNPVNAIDLQAQTVVRAEDIERARRAGLRIRDETRTLLRMITNLLDISKADEGQLAPSPSAIQVDVMVQLIIEELGPLAVAHDVRIDAEIGAREFRADPDLTSRVLANLIENAIRHAPESTRIRVSILAADADVEIRVADQGPGVPHELREAVFERFRSETPTSTRTNRGLGLAFCKLAVEAQGGRIWIEDGSPGAVFCVRLGDAARR